LTRVNPYVAGNPVGGEEAFVGRADVLAETLRMLRQPSASALVLYGQRRIGKTSVLLELAARLPLSGPYLPIYFDLQDKAALPLSRVLGQLADEVRDRVPGLDDEDDDGALTPNEFRDRFLTTALERLATDSSLVFLFDEFDVLDNPSDAAAGADLFPFLRDLMSFQPERMSFVFVIGRRTEDLSNLTLSLFKAMRTVHVSLMEPDDVDKLVRLSERNETLRWSKEAVDDVCNLAGGHPYLTQQLCQEIWENAEENDESIEVVSADVMDAVESTLRSATGALEWLWGGQGPAERVVAAVLAETGPEPIAEDEIHRRLQESGVRILIGELRDAPRVLQEWDIIAPVEGAFRFRVELLRRWIAGHKPIDRVREEMDRVQPVADSLFQAAYGFYQGDDFDQAVPLLRQVTSLNPNHIRGQELLAEILLAQGQRTEARGLLETLYEFQPAVARPRLVQVLLLEAQDVDGAEEKTSLYERVLRLDPNQPEARSFLLQIRRQELARKCEKLGELEEAHRFQDALTLGQQIHHEYPDIELGLPDLETLRGKTQMEDAYQLAVAALEADDRTRARELFVEIVALQADYREATQFLHEAVHGEAPGRARPELSGAVSPSFSKPTLQAKVAMVVLIPLSLWVVALSIEFEKPGAGKNPSESPLPSQSAEEVPLNNDFREDSLAESSPSPPPQTLPTPVAAPPQSTKPKLPKPGELKEDSKVGMRFRYIPPGEFRMGSPMDEIDRDEDEIPHGVTLTRGFWMGETEVTQGQWQRFMDNNPSSFASCGLDCPVEMVSWFDAVAFANRLSKEAELELCYDFDECQGTPGEEGYTCTAAPSKGVDCKGYRLPTEAEWEFAARAGTTTPFWAGENLTTDQANYDGDHPYAANPKGANHQKTVKVRSFKANPWSLHDVHGNVYEWVADWKGTYSKNAVTDPSGPEKGLYRVFRGGSWSHYARYCRAANRNRIDPGIRYNAVGFRLVRTLHLAL
jgi:formylglycine-generating enzyme required for sulfatase activity/tetratricopeptide (TPR) repeat protein